MNIAVIGAGSWGLSLARKLALNQHSVTVWVYEDSDFEKLARDYRIEDYLPGINLPRSIQFTQDLQEISSCVTWVLAVPSHAMRETVGQLNTLADHPEILVNVAKGIENTTLLRMSDVILQELDGIEADQIVTMSGPSHAEEVSRDVPTAVVAACPSLNTAERVQIVFNDETFRVYTNQDIIGAELGGSVKNVIAIAAGILDGLGYGDNSKAALMTRGIAEITRLGLAAGAREETFSGLSGIGDLIVTCLSRHSRNRHVGEQIGRGNKLNNIIGKMKMVAEGVKTTESVVQMAKKFEVEMPISVEVSRVLFDDKSPDDALRDLMSRDPVHERHSM